MRAICLVLLLAVQLGCYAQEKVFKVNASEFYNGIKLAPSAQVLDARTLEEFDLAHLPDAIQIDQKSEDFSAKISKLDIHRPVFVYSIQAGRSSTLAAYLASLSFKEVYVLTPGISAWVGSGYPVVVSQNHAQKLTLATFNNMLSSHDYVLVSYGSDYCAPCKKVVPVLDSLRSKTSEIEIVKIQIEVNPEIIKEHGIRTIPTTILYKGGKSVWTKTGIPNVDEILLAKHEN